MFLHPLFLLSDVDIVLGAPPYYDSTDGIDGQSWKEALAISKLIRKLQKHQRDHHIFFSVETAVVRKGEYVSMDQGDVRKLEEAFEVSWSLELDAKFFSPVRRKSRFFSNIPVTSKQTDYCGRHNEDVAGCCILRGYQHGGNSPIARFPGIMPGKERIDDKRMLVFRQGQKETGIISKQRTLTTKEREIMMGFPNNYVSKHRTYDKRVCTCKCSVVYCLSQIFLRTKVKTLFTELMQKGYGTTFDFQHYWKLNLAKIYHRFGGGPHKFDSSGIYNKNDEPLVLLELRPRSAQEVSLLTSELC